MKSQGIAVVCALLGGGIGIHKFYLGKMKQGLLYFFFAWTFIPALIAFVEIFVLAFMDEDKFDEKYNKRYHVRRG